MATKYRLAGNEAVSRQKNSLHFGRQMCVIDKPSTTNNKLHAKYNNVARMNFLAIFFAVPKNIAHFSLLFQKKIRNFVPKYRIHEIGIVHCCTDASLNMLEEKMIKQPNMDFDEYIRQGEPDKREKASIWQTAIGLQAVDGLKTSDYLKATARRHIEGDIDIDQARELIKTYYQSKTVHEPDDDEKQEADKVSANITKILSTKTLDFSTKGYIALHRRIFEGVMKHAGELRTYDITKKEWVLEGDTVNYLNFEDLRRAIDYDLEQERKFSYKGISQDVMIAHISRFVSSLWQIHAFGEGNTRTTAVFTILYLRHIGFKVNNDMFAQHSWYFRNALVRANYKNAVKGIDYSPIYLERFFRNLLLSEQWDLRNRYLHIYPTEEWKVQPNRLKVATSSPKVASSESKVATLKKKVSAQEMSSLILEFCSTWRSIDEIAKFVNRDKNYIRNKVLPRLTEKLEKEFPAVPNHPRQRYKIMLGD